MSSIKYKGQTYSGASSIEDASHVIATDASGSLTTVQALLDAGAGIVELTQAQYDALPTATKNDGRIYAITDGTTTAIAEDVLYDNSDSDFVATNVQDAIDETGIIISNILDGFASVEATATASKAYEAGDYLVYDNKFYVVTDDISQGGTITPNTNVDETTVGEEFTKRCLLDGVKMVETARIIPTTVALSPNEGKVLTALTGQSLTATIPEGYILAGHTNIVINGQAGMYPIFDGSQMKLTTIDPFIFNVGSGTLPVGSNLTIRLYSLVVKTTGVLTGGTHEAASIIYDNTASGLTATNVQSALDEVNNKTSTRSNFTSSIVNFSDHQLRKTDNLVVFTGSINALSAAVTTWHTVGNIPSGYRPAYTVFFSGCDAWGQMFLMRIYPTGEITLWLDGGTYSNGYLQFNMSWFTA